MFLPLFHNRMREQRLKRSISQKQASDVCGVSSKRWSNLERGYRRPTLAEFWRISRYLSLGDCFPIPSKANKTLLDQGACLTPVAAPYFVAKDRRSHIRYRFSCRRYGSLTQLLTQRIVCRDDFAMCQYLCHQICSDSSLETLNILNLLARGALPALATPDSLGRTPHTIIEPSNREPVGHRPQPCLIHQGTFNFYQVSFLAQHVKRVDVLQWSKEWNVLEINGTGHDPVNDDRRAKDIGIPVVWKTEDEIVAEAQELVSSLY